VQANDLKTLMDNRILIYSLFAVYGVFTVAFVIYIQMKFRKAAGVLQKLQTEWDTADARHAGFVGAAQEQISKLAVPATAPPSSKQTPVTFDTRNQVVILGMARLGK
jgi:hypothetical protein